MGFVNKLVFWIIPLIFLVIIVIAFFGEESLFDSVKEVVKGITTIGEEIGIGAQTTPGEKPVLPAEHKVAIKSLRETMESMKGKENCVAQYKPKLPPLGKPGTLLIFEKAPNGYHVIVKGGKDGVQEILEEKFDLENVRLCVIAGDLVAESFYASALTSEQLGKPAFKETNTLSISFDGDNRISYDGGNSELRDNGWLYTPGDNNICFFPTTDSSFDEYNNLGLHQKFLEGNGEGSIQYALSRTLRLCSQPEEEWTKYNSIELFGNTGDNVEQKKIRQGCSGFVGKDCPSEDYDCDKKFPQEVSTLGCWIMVSNDRDFSTNDCAWGEATEGQILDSFSSSTNRNIILAENENGEKLFYGNSDAETMFQSKIWQTFPERALVCLDKQWIECTPKTLGKTIQTNNKMFLCAEGESTTWIPVSDADTDGIFDTPFPNYCHPGETQYCTDNCPSVSNPLQEDKDEDTFGDQCDRCPDVKSDYNGQDYYRLLGGCPGDAEYLQRLRAR